MINVLAPALLFCIAMAGTQAWLIYRWPPRMGGLWVGVNVLGLLGALLASQGVVYLLVYGLNLDVLQNGLHGGIVLGTAILVFGVILSLCQWSVLRQRLNAPVLRAITHVVIGTITWALLGMMLFGRFGLGDFSWGLLLFAAAGILAGGVSDRIIRLWVRPQ